MNIRRILFGKDSDIVGVRVDTNQRLLSEFPFLWGIQTDWKMRNTAIRINRWKPDDESFTSANTRTLASAALCGRLKGEIWIHAINNREKTCFIRPLGAIGKPTETPDQNWLIQNAGSLNLDLESVSVKDIIHVESCPPSCNLSLEQALQLGDILQAITVIHAASTFEFNDLIWKIAGKGAVTVKAA